MELRVVWGGVKGGVMGWSYGWCGVELRVELWGGWCGVELRVELWVELWPLFVNY